MSDRTTAPLSRRTVLRGAGVALALLWLVSMSAFAKAEDQKPDKKTKSKFTIETVGGKVTASWKGTADTSGIDLAPTDDELAALADHPEIEAIRISGTTRLTGKGFAALKGLPKLRELSLNGTGPNSTAPDAANLYAARI